jgi:membrane protein
VREALARIRALLVEPEAEPLRKRVAVPLYGLRVAIQLGKQWARDRCPQIAGALTFQSVLCLVPLLAVAFGLLQATGQLSAQSALVSFLSDRIFPAIGEDLFEHLMDFVNNVRKGALGPFGIAITIVISYTLFHSVEKVYGQIWRIERGRTLLSKFLVFYTLATLFPLLAGLTLYHTAKYWGGARGPLFSFVSTWVALALLNKLLPRTPVRWRAAVAGATISALLFEMAKYLFASYVTRIALDRYRGVYGTVAIVPILLVWVYVAWLVTLFGAECAHAAQNLRMLEALDRRARGDVDRKVNGVVALRLLVAIATHFKRGGKALAEPQLAELYDLDEDTVTRVAARLRDCDLVVEVAQTEVTGLMLARPPETIPVLQVLDAFRTVDIRGGEPAPRLDLLLRELEAVRRERTSAVTLADLLIADPA